MNIAAAQLILTQIGTDAFNPPPKKGDISDGYTRYMMKRPRVKIPTVFCASFAP